MSRIVVSQFVSADGVIEDPVGMEGLGRGSWTHASFGQDGTKFKLDEVMDTEAMLFGRKTYDAYSNSTVLKGDVADAARSVKQRHAGNIMIQGSAQLARSATAWRS